MKVVGLFNILRSGLSTLLRVLSRATVWLGDAIALVSDLADPAMPESIFRPREWMPRLWDRTGGRTPAEDRG